jgi:hypothetical protein
MERRGAVGLSPVHIGTLRHKRADCDAILLPRGIGQPSIGLGTRERQRRNGQASNNPTAKANAM